MDVFGVNLMLLASLGQTLLDLRWPGDLTLAASPHTSAHTHIPHSRGGHSETTRPCNLLCIHCVSQTPTKVLFPKAVLYGHCFPIVFPIFHLKISLHLVPRNLELQVPIPADAGFILRSRFRQLVKWAPIMLDGSIQKEIHP